MIIPKHIDELIKRRAAYAQALTATDSELSDWLNKHHIPVSPDDYMTGCEMYINPQAAANRIREAIRNTD